MLAYIQEKYSFKKHDFEEKINFKKQILKKILHTESHVQFQFAPYNANILRITCNSKKHEFEEKNFF